MHALPQDDVRQVLGNARFLLARRDLEMIREAIATASAESNHALATWDPENKGFTMETVAYDLASMATHALHRIGANSARIGSVSFTFRLRIGDYIFRMRGSQAHRRGDIVARVVDMTPQQPLHPAVVETGVRVLLNGGRVIVVNLDGTADELVWVPFDARSW